MHFTLAAHPLVLVAASTSKSKGSPIGTFVLLAVILFAGYMLLIRPSRARQRRALDQRKDIDVGAEVMTTAQMIATVVAIDEDVITLEIAPGVHSRFMRSAIVRVITPDEEEPAPDDTTTATTTTEETPPEVAPPGMV